MLCLFPKQIELVEIELRTGCFSRIVDFVKEFNKFLRCPSKEGRCEGKHCNLKIYTYAVCDQRLCKEVFFFL